MRWSGKQYRERERFSRIKASDGFLRTTKPIWRFIRQHRSEMNDLVERVIHIRHIKSDTY